MKRTITATLAAIMLASAPASAKMSDKELFDLILANAAEKYIDCWSYFKITAIGFENRGLKSDAKTKRGWMILADSCRWCMRITRNHGREDLTWQQYIRGPVTCLALALALAGGATGAAAQGDCEAMAKGVDRTNCFIIRGRIAKRKSQLAGDKARLGINSGKLSGVTGRRADEPSSAETPPLPARKQAGE